MFEWVGQERVSLAVVCQRLFEAGVELWPNLGDGGVRKAAYRGG
jgi:hypothetical protein